jgi:membrane protein required for beta-lactamase induction
MGFLAVLLALLLEQGLRHLEPLRGPQWFRAYYEPFAQFARNSDPTPATAVALIIVLVPAVIALFLGALLEQVWGGPVFGYAFQVAILLFCFGPRDLHSQADAFIAAVQAGDAKLADALAAEIIDAPAPASAAERAQAVTRAVLVESNARMFGVLFWFGLLGPAGAVLYRCSDFLRHEHDAEASAAFHEGVARLYGVLAWAPAHLTAMGYAFAGSFEDAVTDLKAYYHSCTLQFFHVSNDVLLYTGLGAIRAAAGEEAGVARIKSALGLVRRTLIIWLAIFALLTIFGWSW